MLPGCHLELQVEFAGSHHTVVHTCIPLDDQGFKGTRVGHGGFINYYGFSLYNHFTECSSFLDGNVDACKSKEILKVLCKVCPPVKRVAAIPLEAVPKAMLPTDLSLARIRFIKKVLPVQIKNKIPPSSLSIMEQSVSHGAKCQTSRWSAVSKGKLQLKYACCSP